MSQELVQPVVQRDAEQQSRKAGGLPGLATRSLQQRERRVHWFQLGRFLRSPPISEGSLWAT